MRKNRPQQELTSLVNQLHNYESGERFKIVGSDLEFRYEKEPGDKLWRKAYCVTPGKTTSGFGHNKISILTQGTHALSPHLDLPYFCYFQGDFPGDLFTIFSRLPENEFAQPPVLDVRNPYAPMRRNKQEIESLIADKKLPKGHLFSRYGEITYQVFDASLHDRVAVYIERMGVIANLFKTRPHDTFELQCIFNVGNSFDNLKSFPVKHFNGFIARPIVTLYSGEFTEEGIWTNTHPTFPLASESNVKQHCHYVF